jgi:hypothetical protein
MMNFTIDSKSMCYKIHYSSSAVFAFENADTMGERIGRIRQIETDFFDFWA